jgi:hypothetical protein
MPCSNSFCRRRDVHLAGQMGTRLTRQVACFKCLMFEHSGQWATPDTIRSNARFQEAAQPLCWVARIKTVLLLDSSGSRSILQANPGR